MRHAEPSPVTRLRWRARSARPMERGAAVSGCRRPACSRTVPEPLSRGNSCWFDRAGNSVGTVGPIDENMPFSPSLSPDGRHIVTTRTVQGNNDLWLIDADRGVFTRFTFDRPPTSRLCGRPTARRSCFVPADAAFRTCSSSLRAASPRSSRWL